MTPHQMSAVPGDPDERPPVTVPPPGAAAPFSRLRPTVWSRPIIRPRIWPTDPASGYPAGDPYVRRYWTPILGPGAVADLLRLATAAARHRSLPRPLHLDTLASVDLVKAEGRQVAVRLVIPPVPVHLRHRLPQRLRREHPPPGGPRQLGSRPPGIRPPEVH